MKKNNRDAELILYKFIHDIGEKEYNIRCGKSAYKKLLSKYSDLFNGTYGTISCDNKMDAKNMDIYVYENQEAPTLISKYATIVL